MLLGFVLEYNMNLLSLLLQLKETADLAMPISVPVYITLKTVLREHNILF